MNLFRIHIRPSGGNPDMHATFQHCLDNRVLGVGWRVRGLANTRDWEEYERAARPVHSSVLQPRYIHQNVAPGDLVWTRDPAARYYLARVTDRWEYWQDHAGRKKDIDIANVFRCDLHEVQMEAVPGTVVSSFGYRGRTIQRVDTRSALVYSQHLWNRCAARRPVYEVDVTAFPDIFAMLDPEETEDLVFLYLQSRGWYVVPNSRKGNSLRFEFLLAHSETNEMALTQVKTGHVRLNFDDYADDAQHRRIFLFQSNSQYDGQASNRVESISRDQLEGFLRDRIELFPPSFETKLALVDATATHIVRAPTLRGSSTGASRKPGTGKRG